MNFCRFMVVIYCIIFLKINRGKIIKNIIRNVYFYIFFIFNYQIVTYFYCCKIYNKGVFW